MAKPASLAPHQTLSSSVSAVSTSPVKAYRSPRKWARWFASSEVSRCFQSSGRPVRLALAGIGDERLKACDVEAALPQPSYTIHTIEHLQRLYPDVQFVVLAGSDIADQLSRWYRSDELQRMVQFLIYPRNNGTASPEMAQAPMFEGDSTSVRRAVATGQKLRNGLLPVSVEEYIRNKNLYRV